MAGASPGVQVPPDGVGKILGGFPISQPDGTIVWVGATVIVDPHGTEIGKDIFAALKAMSESIDKLSEALVLAGVIS